MTPFASVAMLEKLALLKIAFCKAPVFSRASSRRTSVSTSTGVSHNDGVFGSATFPTSSRSGSINCRIWLPIHGVLLAS